MRFHFRGFVVAAIALASLVVTGCGENGSATYVYGPYSAQRSDSDYDRHPSRARGILAESLRLGERLVYATDVDPELTVGRGGGVMVDHTGVTGTMLSGPQQTALDDFQVLAGFGAIAANKPYTKAEQPEKFLAVSILSFADEQTAAAAARAMERMDFETNTDNAPVTVDAYPGALNHWRPGVPSVGSWLASKSLVIRVLAELPEPDLGRLTDMVARTLRRQLAELETFTPTPASEIAALRQDPEGLLMQLVATGDFTPDDRNFAVYGPRTFALLLGNPATDREANRDVTAIAVSYNKFLYRLRDGPAATAFADYENGLRGDAEYVPMRGIANRPTITCAQGTVVPQRQVEARRYRCVIRRDEFVAIVYSNADTDVRQLAAAQYALLGERS